MPLADIAIAIVVVISVIVGFVRGFIKEAISISALLFAIWATFHFGDDIGEATGGWLSSPELQAWFGRILVFVILVTLGGLLGWGIGKLVRLSVLSGTDRALGMLFGFGRGVLIFAVLVMAGQFANFDNDDWWRRSVLIPYGEFVADWLRLMAPKGFDLFQESVEKNLDLDVLVPDFG